MAGSKLDPYKAEILGLLGDGASQVQIMRHFQQRGVDIPRSTLSDFVRQQQGGDIATASLDDAGVAARYEASMRFQRGTADEVIDKLADVYEGVQQLKQEGDTRHQEMTHALQQAMEKDTSAVLVQALEATSARLDALAARTTGAALRWVWVKALVYTGCAWAALCAAAYIYLVR